MDAWYHREGRTGKTPPALECTDSAKAEAGLPCVMCRERGFILTVTNLQDILPFALFSGVDDGKCGDDYG